MEALAKREELTLLDQEFKLAFTYTDRDSNSMVSARVLKDALLDFQLATDLAHLETFMAILIAKTSLLNVSGGSGGESDDAGGTRTVGARSISCVAASEGLRRSTTVGEQRVGGADDPMSLVSLRAAQTDVDRLISFEALEASLTAEQIVLLRPASLVLHRSPHSFPPNGGEDVRSVGVPLLHSHSKLASSASGCDGGRARRSTQLPARDRVMLIWQRFQMEIVHYTRGAKLFKEQLLKAWKLLGDDLIHVLTKRKIPLSDRRLLKLVLVDLIKLVPLLTLAVLPGGSLVVVIMARLLPSTMPSTFQNAPRWEKYSLVEHMVRDAVESFTVGVAEERIYDQEWEQFVQVGWHQCTFLLPEHAYTPRDTGYRFARHSAKYFSAWFLQHLASFLKSTLPIFVLAHLAHLRFGSLGQSSFSLT
jgi:hypothetical protein